MSEKHKNLDIVFPTDVFNRMRRQAERWGAELYLEDVEFLDLKNRPFTVQSSERKVILNCRACLLLHKSQFKYFLVEICSSPV